MSPRTSSWLAEAEVGVESLREAPGHPNQDRTVYELCLGPDDQLLLPVSGRADAERWW